MLGHVYIVEDARDLAQIVRDVTRYGGAYRPEVLPTVLLFSKKKSYYIFRIFTSLFREDQTGRK